MQAETADLRFMTVAFIDNIAIIRVSYQILLLMRARERPSIFWHVNS